MDISYIILDNLPWFWFILAVVLTLFEGLTMGLTTIWFAAGSLVMVFVSLTNLPFSWQILIFLVLSSILLVFTRPIALKKFKPRTVKTNADMYVDQTGLVVKKITKFEKGEVKVDGKIWTARAENDEVIEKGSECLILRIEGVTLIVSPVPPAQEEKA